MYTVYKHNTYVHAHAGTMHAHIHSFVPSHEDPTSDSLTLNRTTGRDQYRSPVNQTGVPAFHMWGIIIHRY